MTRIVIKDLPQEMTITRDEMKRVVGGALDMDAVFSKLGGSTPNTESPYANDSSNTADAMILQQMMQKYTLSTHLKSNPLTTLKY